MNKNLFDEYNTTDIGIKHLTYTTDIGIIDVKGDIYGIHNYERSCRKMEYK